MAKVTGIGLISGIDLYTTDTIPTHTVGTIVWDGNSGKAYRYALIGAVALVMGNLLQEAVEDTSYENMALGTAAVVGDASLQITNGTATITSKQFEGGSILSYTAGTVAVGDEYTIVGVTGTLTTGGALNVFLDNPVRTAATTSSKWVMKRSVWSGVIQFPATTPTGIAAGVAIVANAASTSTVLQYGWVQTHGPAAVLSDGSTFAVGSAVGTPSGTAGCITVYAAATTKQVVGIAREAAASAHAISVHLTID